MFFGMGSLENLWIGKNCLFWDRAEKRSKTWEVMGGLD